MAESNGEEKESEEKYELKELFIISSASNSWANQLAVNDRESFFDLMSFKQSLPCEIHTPPPELTGLGGQ